MAICYAKFGQLLVAFTHKALLISDDSIYQKYRYIVSYHIVHRRRKTFFILATFFMVLNVF